MKSRPHTATRHARGAAAGCGDEGSQRQLAAANAAFKMVAAEFQISAAGIVCSGA